MSSSSPQVLRQLRQTIDDLNAQLEEQQRLLDHASLSIRENKAELQSKDERIEALSGTVAELEGSQHAWKQKAKELQQALSLEVDGRRRTALQLKKLEDEISNQRHERNAQQMAANQRDLQLQALNMQTQTLKEKLDEKEQIISESQFTLQSADTQLGVLEQRNAMLEREAVQSSASFQEKIRQLEHTIEVDGAKAEAACNENVGLKAQLDALRCANQRLLTEMSRSTQTLSEQWAASQLRFHKDVQRRVDVVSQRLDRALRRQEQMANLLTRSAKHARDLAARVARKKRVIQDIKLLLSREQREKSKLDQNLKNHAVSLDRVKREHSLVCERLSSCTRRLASSAADVELLRKERDEAVEKAQQQTRSIERLEHDCEMHRNLGAELKAELAAARTSQEQREIDRTREIERLSSQDKDTRESLLEENIRLRKNLHDLKNDLSLERSKPKMFDASLPTPYARPPSKQTDELIELLKQSYDKQGVESRSVDNWHQELLDKVEHLIHRVEGKVSDQQTTLY